MSADTLYVASAAAVCTWNHNVSHHGHYVAMVADDSRLVSSRCSADDRSESTTVILIQVGIDLVDVLSRSNIAGEYVCMH